MHNNQGVGTRRARAISHVVGVAFSATADRLGDEGWDPKAACSWSTSTPGPGKRAREPAQRGCAPVPRPRTWGGCVKLKWWRRVVQQSGCRWENRTSTVMTAMKGATDGAGNKRKRLVWINTHWSRRSRDRVLPLKSAGNGNARGR